MGCLKVLQSRKDCPQLVRDVITGYRKAGSIDGEDVLDAFRRLADVIADLEWRAEEAEEELARFEELVEQEA